MRRRPRPTRTAVRQPEGRRLPPPRRPPPLLPRIGPTTPAREARAAGITPDAPERTIAVAAVSYRSHAHGTGFVFHAAHARACEDRKSTRLNSSHTVISYAVFCLKKKK